MCFFWQLERSTYPRFVHYVRPVLATLVSYKDDPSHWYEKEQLRSFACVSCWASKHSCMVASIKCLYTSRLACISWSSLGTRLILVHHEPACLAALQAPARSGHSASLPSALLSSDFARPQRTDVGGSEA